MKKIILASVLVLFFSLTIAELEARGGRGGGGGRGAGPRGGGGGSRAGGGGARDGGARNVSRANTLNRTPTIARSPNIQRTPNRQNISRTNLPSNVARNPNISRNNVNQFLKQNPNIRTNAPQRSFQPSQISSKWQNSGRNVRSNLANNPNTANFFGRGSWGDRNMPAYARGLNRAYWRGASADNLANYLGWGYGYGYDSGYYYGDGDYYTYTPTSDGSTNNYTEINAPTTNYVQQAAPVMPVAPATQASSDDWMSLGVFAVVNKGTADVTTPNFYIQLSVNKQAEISGMLYNSTTNQSYEIDGAVDKATQKVAWEITGNENGPIAMTGLYNLTLPETPVQLAFSDGRTQDMLMIRLDETQQQ